MSNSVCVGFDTAMRTGSSKRLKRFPATHWCVLSRLPFTVDYVRLILVYYPNPLHSILLYPVFLLQCQTCTTSLRKAEFDIHYRLESCDQRTTLGQRVSFMYVPAISFFKSPIVSSPLHLTRTFFPSRSLTVISIILEHQLVATPVKW